ncbi:unnamed protein product [Cylicostephanus goldi]|uniref:Major sperm protein n=1 Tax=Cylicostephanus goldi TaxID=71465 RepID=A0A3P6S8V7_CYLGO|nr:unnamed protein product [Cylicostephanus goldi]
MSRTAAPTPHMKELKDVKDVKEQDAQHSQHDMPPFLQQQPITTPAPLRLTNVNPLVLVFDGPPNAQCQKSLNITNASNDRIAWRVLSNAPTRYVVSPNKGFLFKQERIAVQVILLNGSKYHRRHAFVVQVKPARLEENNRKVRDLALNEYGFKESLILVDLERYVGRRSEICPKYQDWNNVCVPFLL